MYDYDIFCLLTFVVYSVFFFASFTVHNSFNHRKTFLLQTNVSFDVFAADYYSAMELLVCFGHGLECEEKMKELDYNWKWKSFMMHIFLTVARIKRCRT